LADVKRRSAVTNSPENNVVYALAALPDFAPGEEGTAFAASASGLRRSDDGGRSWQEGLPSLELPEPLPVTSIAVSPDFANDGSLFVGAPGGILCSENGGAQWQITTLPTPPPVVADLVISPHFREDGVLLAATVEDGVFRSSDRGQRWKAWNFGLLDLRLLCLSISPAFAADETLFAGTESGLFRSTNGGRAWREVPLPGGYDPVLSVALSPHFDEDDALFVGKESGAFLLSRDRGASWEVLGIEGRAEPVNGIVLRSGCVVLLRESTPLLSCDGGARWAPLTTAPAPRPGMTALLVPQGFEAGARLLAGYADGELEILQQTRP
jgi:photosystem II stability/assembly factor-like uncharacterized protein